jgi:transcriptional regulator with XRE-family HTH domain
LYEKFERLLAERNLTSYKVSLATGIAQSSLSDWKRGVSKPKVDKLQILADYFGVPLDYFLKE